MIRQPRRSTAASAASRCAQAVTTTKRNKNTRAFLNKNLTFILFIGAAFIWEACAAWPADYEDADAMAVGSSSHAPKFGERLLPLRKKTSANLKYGASGAQNTTATTSTTTTSTTMKSVNSLNFNKNNYIVSNSQQQQQLKNDKNSASKFNNNNNNKNEQLDLVTVVPLADFDIKLSRRQGKQLHRRQDLNVAEVLELAAQTTAATTPQQQQQQAHADVTAASNASSLKADRLVEMSTEFFVVPTPHTTPSTSRTPTPHAIATTRNPLKSRNSVKTSRGVSGISAGSGPRSVLIVAPKPNVPHSKANVSSAAAPPSIISTHLHGSGGLRKEPWVVPVLVLAALTMLMMAAFEIFVLFKAWRTSPSRRHLFLGQMLLLGLFGCAGLGAIITAQPSLLSCGTLRFGVGVAYALVFAALLVKCVFLISLNGGVYLPAPYQGLLLLFAVLIQVAIGAQWLLTTPPELYTLSVPLVDHSGVFATASTAHSGADAASAFARVFNAAPAASPTPAELYTHASQLAGGSMLIPLCKTQFSELLLSLIYIVFLIVFVSVLAIKSRGIRDNYREATYIGLAIGGAIPIWLGWMLCGLAVAERHKDACVAFGLVATSATVFLVMFMPKGRQLAAMGKEGLYVEDREEQFSSLSRAGSGYSPSFFHFKPIKYGVMGGMQNSPANTGNATSMKHCSNGLSGGDRVALVTAAPPSYTRMYHYFPAHLTHPFCFYPQPPPPPPLPQMTQLAPPPPPTLKQLGNSITSMTQAHIAQTLRYPGLFIRPDETNLYTTLEPTLSSNPNVFFQRGNAVHPGMMY